MTSDEYRERNLQGFEGDMILKQIFADLITKHDIEVIIETGTFLGGTTKQLASMVERVITVEINPEFYVQAAKHLTGLKNVQMWHNDSSVILPTILEQITELKSLHKTTSSR